MESANLVPKTAVIVLQMETARNANQDAPLILLENVLLAQKAATPATVQQGTALNVVLDIIST